MKFISYIIFQIYYIRLKENSFPSSSVSNRDSDANSSKRNTNNEDSKNNDKNNKNKFSKRILKNTSRYDGSKR